jgi:hypothetical protein
MRGSQTCFEGVPFECKAGPQDTTVNVICSSTVT